MEEMGNRYLTTWEKRMRKALEQKVEEDYMEYMEEFKPVSGKPFKLDCSLVDRKKYWCEDRMEKYEEIYRREHTLRILKKCGFNTDEFLKTNMGTRQRLDMLLACVQDKIDGFDYDEYEDRVPNNKKMDVKNMTVSYEGDVLKISDGNTTYDFKIDEHELIYVNGEQVFTLTEISTPEEIQRDLQAFHNNLEAARRDSDYAMQKSLEDASKFWVK